MKFRTEIELPRSAHRIYHDDGGVLLLGSCFSDNIGERLEADGFKVCHNPMGPLYNPASLANFINCLLRGYKYTRADLTLDDDGRFHSLDFAMRYSGTNADELLRRINYECADISRRLLEASTVIITFGTAWCFEYGPTNRVAGNCHKLPSTLFTRVRLLVDTIAEMWQPLVDTLNGMGKHLIFTVSPIRHLADGLHGNELSKATLLLAVDRLRGAEYFPAYEIMIDDLRDYRFYADDLKHPSTMAVSYIYELFASSYFTKQTAEEARLRHATKLREAHRPLL